MKVKAVAYLRVSTEDQQVEGYSLPTQLEEIRSYASKNGLEIIEVIEEALSGSILDRPGLSKARKLLREKKAQALIAHDSDRVTRSSEHYSILRAEWRRLGIQLHYARRGRIDLEDFGGRVVEGIYGEFAEQWKLKIVEASRRGKRGKVATGKVITAKKPPYGYLVDKEKGELIIHEPEAQVVRLIFKLYTVDGLSMYAIAEYLTERTYPTPADGKPKSFKRKGWGVWSNKIVGYILKNETYCGTWHWGKRKVIQVVNEETGKKQYKQFDNPREDWIEVEVPAIVSREVWDEAQARYSYNYRMKKRNLKNDYLLSRRLVCGVCGRPIWSTVATTSHGEKAGPWFYYFCSSKSASTDLPKCSLPYFRAEDVDDSTWAWVEMVGSNQELMERLLNETVEKGGSNRQEKQTELHHLREKIERKEGGLKRLLRKFGEGDIDEKSFDEVKAEVGQELAELKRREGELNTELANMPTRERVDSLLAVYRKDYQSFFARPDKPFEIKKAWVETLRLGGVLWVDEEGEKKISINCDLGSFILGVTGGIHLNSIHILEVRITLDIASRVSS